MNLQYKKRTWAEVDYTILVHSVDSYSCDMKDQRMENLAPCKPEHDIFHCYWLMTKLFHEVGWTQELRNPLPTGSPV